MNFPISQKTVFLLDHTLSSPSGVKIDLETLGKSKNSNGQNSVGHIPLLPLWKSVWTCAVEALTEYCRYNFYDCISVINEISF